MSEKIIQFPGLKSQEGDRTEFRMSYEQKREFIFKFAWIVNIIHSLRQSDPRAFNVKNVRVRRDILKDADDEEIYDKIMKAEEFLIKKHPSQYEALTDEVMARKMNKLQRN